MSAFISNFHFLHPLWLGLLLGLPLAAWCLNRSLRGDNAFTRLVDAAMLPLLMSKGKRGRVLPLSVLVWCWLVACLALAGPAWERLPTPMLAGGGARVMALSLNDAMLAQDVKPDRLTQARFKIRDLLQRSGDARNALIGYAGDAFVVAPLTRDAQTITNLLGALDPSVMPVAGDDTGRAIDLGVKLLQQAGMHGGDILLVAATASDNAVAAARRARRAGVHVSVLAVGSIAGAPMGLPSGGFRKDDQGHLVVAHLQAKRLQAVANAGDGIYQPMRSDASDLEAFATVHGSRHVDASAHKSMTPQWRDRGPWLLILLLPLVALGFRRGWLLVLPLLWLVPSPAAHATGWLDAFHNADQKAAAALADGHAKRAASLAHDPAWRGTALYRSGDYAAAAKSYAEVDGAKARYNYGNAMAKQGKYEQAIKAYDQALQLNPALTDAATNRKAIEDWMKQQKQQQQKQKQANNKGAKSDPNAASDKSKQPSSSANNKKSQASKPNASGQKSAGDKQSPEQGKDGAASSTKSQADGKPSQAKSASSTTKADSKRNQQKPAASATAPETPSQTDQEHPASAASAAAQAAAQQVQVQKAQQALKQEMDKALSKKPTTHTYMLGQAADKDKSHLPVNMRETLQRVPDDPGGLLRRKFQLEYQRRQQTHQGGPM